LLTPLERLGRLKKVSFGIAIAPFDVCSLDPDTLGTSAKLQALDVVTKQFFSAVQRIISEEDWSKDFEFRFLPANVQIHRKKDAIARTKSLDATMLIWATILQHSNRPINMTMCVLGPDLDMKIDGSLDFFFVPFFKLWALTSAASCLEAKRRIPAIRTTNSGAQYFECLLNQTKISK
jgi:hypothetical protein